MTQETVGVHQRTNVTLPEALLREASQLNITMSQACERGLAAAVLEMKAAGWRIGSLMSLRMLVMAFPHAIRTRRITTARSAALTP